MIQPEDIHPVSSFRRDIKAALARLAETGRPEILTVNGRAHGVIMSPGAFQQLVDDAELARSLRTVEKSLAQLDEGQGRPIQSFLNELRGIAVTPDA